MKIDINDHRKLHAIQEEFAVLFPNLKLQFHSKASHESAHHPKKLIEAGSKTLGECRSVHNKGSITISAGMTIADMQSNFSDVYGIDVEVLKKSGSSWTEPDSKNKLSLEEQNKNT